MIYTSRHNHTEERQEELLVFAAAVARRMAHSSYYEH